MKILHVPTDWRNWKECLKFVETESHMWTIFVLQHRWDVAQVALLERSLSAKSRNFIWRIVTMSIILQVHRSNFGYFANVYTMTVQAPPCSRWNGVVLSMDLSHHRRHLFMTNANGSALLWQIMEWDEQASQPTDWISMQTPAKRQPILLVHRGKFANGFIHLTS